MSSTDKAKLRELLEKRDLAGVIDWTGDHRGALRKLFSLTFDSGDLLRWRAIEATGKAAAAVFEAKPDKVRDFIRRLLWLMNDESGGLGWHAPEVLGEILFNIPRLVAEYGRLLPAFMKEEPFEAGSRFAIYRASLVAPGHFSDCAPELGSSLSDPNAYVRGFAALALGVIGARDFLPALKEICGDSGALTLYDFDRGQLIQTSVGEIARRQIELL